MLDEQIVDMYWARNEDAITETEKKYGNYCHAIADRILRSDQDSIECVNDTYLRAWNSMPTQRPSKLAAFLGKIVRNLALDRYEYYAAEKRGGIQTKLALEELDECASGGEDPESIVDEAFLADIINNFLKSLSEKNRNIFVSRYWHLFSVKEIAYRYSLTESNVRTSLCRSREILKEILIMEGVYR